MSHLTERTEKNCLNCGTEVIGRYCHVCGQENLEPKETVLHLVTHFVNDITHFDGKFFSTLKYLLFKPGFLSEEYIRGRRMSYLHPIRLYVFTSAIFFLVFFSLNGANTVDIKDEGPAFVQLNTKLGKLQKELAAETNAGDRSDDQENITSTQKKIVKQGLALAKKAASGQSIAGDTAGLAAAGGQYTFDSLVADVKRHPGEIVMITDDNDSTNYNLGLAGEHLPDRVSAYDSMETALPPTGQHSAFVRYVNRRLVAMTEKRHRDPERFKEETKESILHTFPKILFVSLPLFALFLRLLNVSKRRRKQFFYVDHGIFTIHLYVATFIVMLVILPLQKLKDNYNIGWLAAVMTILVLSVFVYEYIAMLRFYKQGWFKTFVKFCLLNTAAAILLGLLTAVFSVWAVMSI
ncbi:DUF3667 domain-containing protein [Dinghuibacter silviterrae]|uniref:Uncharacterized protein DUF3667 n=1 Tax=Dinghuibacter silviterrae TaxID=1539049 RepID=A0A4R8DFG8_9BACT|nr:DUF3667 domain-containing protein [Dinghuibacter silviterrae]TDW96339.1 uncharacterized protein DUF3667 [Dinghuibacter silviterrae]